MKRRARQCSGNGSLWYLQEWREDCFHPGCEDDGHWVTLLGNMSKDEAESLSEAHNRAIKASKL